MKKPRYVHHFIDRHGQARLYFRRRGFKQVPLPGPSWASSAFQEAYSAAMKGEMAPRKQVAAERTVPGTINALVVAYYNSDSFRGLRPSTQATYRGIIERFRRENGHRSVASLTRAKIREMLGNRADTPTAANNWLRMVRTLMQFAIDIEMRADDPTLRVKGLKVRSAGFLIWGEEHISRYRARHPLGTRARLACELLLNTGQRRSDVVQMGPQHVRDGTLAMRQQKTGMLIEIPVLPELREALDAMPSGDHLCYLMTEFGKPFTAAGFGNWFRDQCNAAGLPTGYAAHGLRKAAATYWANRGATAHQLMAWFGWTTLKEPERYTRTANRRQLAASMVAGVEITMGTTSGKPQ